MEQHRNKPGRPAKAILVVAPSESDESHTELSGNAALVAVSPIDEEINASSPTTVTAVSDSVECRRSSRKKIPKFDVRDLLLNKHRRPHKIQIEARFDSNAPTTTKEISTTSNSSNTSAAPSRQEKCFIEKTSIIERTIVTEAKSQVPIPVTTEIYKPSQGSSLIVAQMESSSSGLRHQQQQLQQQSQKSATKVKNLSKSFSVNESDTNVPKRRGRPPKNRSLTEKLFDKNNRKSTNEEPTILLVDKNEASNVTNVSEDVIEIIESQDAVEIQVEPKVVMNANQTATDFEENLPTNEVKHTKQILSTFQAAFESAFLKETGITSTQKINVHKQPTEKLPESSQPKVIDIVVNTTQAAQVDLPTEPESANISIDLTTEESQPETQASITEIKDLEQVDSVVTSANVTTTPTPRRYERRGTRRLDDGSTSNKTLEETFAEIAAKSSKAILDMAEQKSDEDSSISTGDESSMQACKGQSSESSSLDSNITKTESIANEQIIAPKRRGRKPKPKIQEKEQENNEIVVVVVEDDVSNEEKVISEGIMDTKKNEQQELEAINTPLKADIKTSSDVEVEVLTPKSYEDPNEKEITLPIIETVASKAIELVAEPAEVSIQLVEKTTVDESETFNVKETVVNENPPSISPQTPLKPLKKRYSQELAPSPKLDERSNSSHKSGEKSESKHKSDRKDRRDKHKDKSADQSRSKHDKERSKEETKHYSSHKIKDKERHKTKTHTSPKSTSRTREEKDSPKQSKDKLIEKKRSENEKSFKKEKVPDAKLRKNEDSTLEKVKLTDKEDFQKIKETTLDRDTLKDLALKKSKSISGKDTEISSVKNDEQVTKPITVQSIKETKVNDNNAFKKEPEKSFPKVKCIENAELAALDAKEKELSAKLKFTKIKKDKTSQDDNGGSSKQKDKEKLGEKIAAPAATSTPTILPKKDKQYLAAVESPTSSSYKKDAASSSQNKLKKIDDPDKTKEKQQSKRELKFKDEPATDLQTAIKKTEEKDTTATALPESVSTTPLENIAELIELDIQQKKQIKAEETTLSLTHGAENKVTEPTSTLLDEKPQTNENVSGSESIINQVAKEQPSELTNTKASTETADPFFDIAKFIEDGVNLLKRDYKLAEEVGEVVRNANAIEEATKNAKKNEQTAMVNIETAREAAAVENPMENVVENIKSDETILPEMSAANETSILDLYETPADTPNSTMTENTPSTSPIPTDNTDNTENSLDTYYYSDGKRRSHRLKKITSAPKALEGRGLAKLHYSLENHLTDLAEVEAKNAKFLKEMEERLSNFEVIKENVYHCERLVSREARKMICDCFLTAEEAERGELGCGEDCLNRLLMIECGTNCKVGERCTNRRFQKYLCAPCRVFRTEKKGFGIMADVEIHPGEFIMEYVGEVLDSDEFEERRLAYSKDKNRHYYFMALRSDAIIDATTKGNISRFINHSCDPNAETQKWTVNGELRIGFFSRKTILPGEEITFDYQYQRYGREAQRCYCESANCRGWIGEEPNSDEGEQVDDDDEEDDEEEELLDGLLDDVDLDDDGKVDENGQEKKKSDLLKSKAKDKAEARKAGELVDQDSDESKQKFMAYLGKISAKIEMHKQNKLEEKKMRKRRKRKQATESRRNAAATASKFHEDPDLEDEIDFLSRCGLKNQSDTLRFSRLMVRAKLMTTRLNLLAILREGELPCRRLFLDYHGLHLLHGWMNEDGRTDMNVRLAIIQTLECLPITNKTVLTDSKVYQVIRGWCSSEKQASLSITSGAGGEAGATSSASPSDESSKESVEQKQQQQQKDIQNTTNDTNNKSEEVEKLSANLIATWEKLPEIFRIPKRERIEQMKEHEREADRQYAATIEATSEETPKTQAAASSSSSTDRYQNDRFERRFGKQQHSGIRSIGVLGGPGNTTGGGGFSGATYKRPTSAYDSFSQEGTQNMTKKQRRELFAAKVARDEAEKRLAEHRREFETKCQFFGLDVNTTRPEHVPFCVSDTGKWYNKQRQEIAKPPAFAHVQTPVKPKSTNPADYYLPKVAVNLPPEWGFAITDYGKIYYFHRKNRIPQWEPPTPQQISQTKWNDTESESEHEEDDEGNEDITEERIKEIEAIQSQDDLTAFLKKIAQEQRQARYKRLVEERPISPRREEDRIYNQIEMRKYKENKEKIKKRKEEIRRRRNEAAKSSISNLCTLGSLTETTNKTTTTTTDNVKIESSELPADALPIQDYLLSSDDDVDHDEDIDEMKAECNNSPLLEKIVQGDKIVDELDALTTKRPLKRPLPPHRDLSTSDSNSNNGNNTTAATTSTTATASSSKKDSASTSSERSEHKKRRMEKKEKSKRNRDRDSDSRYRKLKERFRCDIAGIIVHYLKPYRKDSCTRGRIESNEDFNHLAKKLTHFVTVKEQKYCEPTGQDLVVTESVKNKTREFIKKYMEKYESSYKKPENDPYFKDIPFTL